MTGTSKLVKSENCQQVTPKQITKMKRSNSNSKFTWKKTDSFADLVRSGSEKSITTSTTIFPRPKGKTNELFKKYKNANEQLGFGSSAIVYKFERVSNKTFVAVKIVSTKGKNKRGLTYFINEGNLMRTLNHKNIVTCFEMYQTKSEILLVLDYAAGGDLFTEIINQSNFSFTEEDTKIILRQIISALKYLRKKSLSHRDLKLDQFLLMSPGDISWIKLTDFGFAKSDKKTFRRTLFSETDGYEQKLYKTACGTRAWSAPEVYNMQNKGYTYKADVWSVGVMSYCLLSGFLPYGYPLLELYSKQMYQDYYKETPEQRRTRMKEVKARFSLLHEHGMFDYQPQKLWRGVSAGAIGFIGKMLRLCAEDRACYQELLKDAWLEWNAFSKTSPI
eukprot:snap_masked-scaffold_4-processed-gene-11.38-mRNA-1 protein AED:1.00 eAED:1.00 QI:0/0/0/0/1/1/2/0/389